MNLNDAIHPFSFDHRPYDSRWPDVKISSFKSGVIAVHRDQKVIDSIDRDECSRLLATMTERQFATYVTDRFDRAIRDHFFKINHCGWDANGAPVE